jgi:hypothetical protein
VKLPIGLTGLHFGPDPYAGTPAFQFERKVKTKFSEKKYYSSARMNTKKHLDLLQELENLFG